MTTRKQIKKQHKAERESLHRASQRSQARRTMLRVALAAGAIVTALALAFALRPWGGSSAGEVLPALNLSIGDNFFRPETLTFQAGQKYRLNLVSIGQATHDFWAAGSDGQTQTGDDVRSKPIPGGGSASVKIKYDNPGTYYFVCTFHAGQGGTIIVQ